MKSELIYQKWNIEDTTCCLSELQYVHILSFPLTFQYGEIEMVFIKADDLTRRGNLVIGRLLS